MNRPSFPNTNNQNHQTSNTSSLARYRSAPSSVFANLLNDCGAGAGSVFGNVSVSHEMNTIDALRSVMELEGSNERGYYNSSSVYDLNTGHTHTDSFVLPRGIKLENADSVLQNSLLQSAVFSNSGFSAAREVGNFNSFNGTNGDEANQSASTLTNQINFTSEPISCTSKVGNGSLGITSSENGKLQNGHSGQDSYIPNFTMDYWDVPAVTGLKRTSDGNAKVFSATQYWEEKGHTSGLTRHMSLPSSSTEMAAVAKYLHFQDSTPCKIRAKRGFATHPRSIAERVRRTRISQRMRKLQELFPDMDKQTNTADMLEMAVDYIKNLQKQVDVLTDTKSSCTCSRN